VAFLRRWFRFNATRQGLLGNSRFWMMVFVLQQALKLRRRFLGKEPKVVFSHKLEDGETLVIAHNRGVVEAT
jgi:hypothetical protein